MGAAWCDFHGYTYHIQTCEHLYRHISSKRDLKPKFEKTPVEKPQSVTIIREVITNISLGNPSSLFAYCDICAKKYWLPTNEIFKVRHFFHKPLLRLWGRKASPVCTYCFHEEVFGKFLSDNDRRDFINTTQTDLWHKNKSMFPKIQSTEDKYQLATYKKMNIAAERGYGVWIWTSDMERYLDLYGGHAVTATGHCHPHVVAAIQEQAAQMLFYSNLVYSDVRARAAEKLVSLAPEGLTKAFFCNSGTEANENAMRMARMKTGRENIITFSGGFHGRTADAISATFLGKYREIGRPNVPGHLMAEFGDIESVRAIADDSVAAIMLEPIQSMAGVREASPEFFVALRELCEERGIVLIFDEVQTGIGRTGEWFFAGSEAGGKVVPDIITLAKALGSGVPVGACLVSDSVSEKIKENDLGTTFGGGMLAMAATLATLEAIEQDEMLENVKTVEKHLRERIKEIEQVVAVHGKGFLLGIEFNDKAAPIHAALLEKKIITGTSSKENVLRLLPPLCLKTEEVDLFIETLNEIF